MYEQQHPHDPLVGRDVTRLRVLGINQEVESSYATGDRASESISFESSNSLFHCLRLCEEGHPMEDNEPTIEQ